MTISERGRFALLLSLLLLAAPLHASPLISNGDFSLGNTGFDTSYRYVGRSPDSLWPDGVYTVDTTATGMHSLWETSGDHTTGTGNFMLVNGKTTSPSDVWSHTIETIPGLFYEFSFWAKNLCCTGVFSTLPGPQLAFTLNGAKVSNCDTDGAGIWGRCGMTFLAMSAFTSLGVQNYSDLYSGNDFGLDDFDAYETTPTPEPAALFLLAPGLAMAWRARRR